jgi:hypothetical protein
MDSIKFSLAEQPSIPFIRMLLIEYLMKLSDSHCPNISIKSSFFKMLLRIQSTQCNEYNESFTVVQIIRVYFGLLGLQITSKELLSLQQVNGMEKSI